MSLLLLLQLTSDALPLIALARPELPTHKAFQRGTRKLLDALTLSSDGSRSPELAVSMLILIVQQRQVIINKMDSPHIKLTAELHDKCQETCLQVTFALHLKFR